MALLRLIAVGLTLLCLPLRADVGMGVSELFTTDTRWESPDGVGVSGLFTTDTRWGFSDGASASAFFRVDTRLSGSAGEANFGLFTVNTTTAVVESLALAGQITDTRAAGLAGARVAAQRESLLVAATTTDSGGRFQLLPLPAGAYALTVTHPSHGTAARAVTLSIATAHQDFQLVPLPGATPVAQTSRQPAAAFTQPPVGPLGSMLKVFDGSQFVPIIAGNAPPSDRMTIVLTHGWVTAVPDQAILSAPFTLWPSNMAVQMRTHGVTPDLANIVAWDWRFAASGLPLPPEEQVSAQGVGLGRALQSALGVNYAQPLHFLGHSLGALVNSAAANYLHGDRTAQQEVSATPWSPDRTHVTLSDEAEAAGAFGLAGGSVGFDGITVSLVEGGLQTGLAFAEEARFGWKPAMPVQFAWADNYVSLVGLFQPRAVNVWLQKGLLWINPVAIHSYPVNWYSNSVASPGSTILGFRRSWEYRAIAGPAGSAFPPSTADVPAGAYYQSPLASDELALSPLPAEQVFRRFGQGARFVVQGAASTVQVVGNVVTEVADGARQAADWVSSGFDYVGSVAAQGGQTVVNLLNSASLRLNLRTGPPGGSLRAAGKDGGGTATNTAAMAWVPLVIPTDATAMAFDFAVEGDPVDDVLVCGLGATNLFSLEAKYVPTNMVSASRLIDVSAWAGTTNELFFGLMGGTSTNCTLQIENIRFYSLSAPKLELLRSGSALVLSWPATAGGYVVETSTALAPAAWQAATNVPVVLGDRYMLTNTWSDPMRFFRLRSRWRSGTAD